MDTKDKTIIGLVVLLVLAVLLASGIIGTTGKASLVCSDSDGGKISAVKGSINVIGTGGGLVESATDYCSGNNLVEYTCDPLSAGKVAQDTITCDTSCQDGACI